MTWGGLAPAIALLVALAAPAAQAVALQGAFEAASPLRLQPGADLRAAGSGALDLAEGAAQTCIRWTGATASIVTDSWRVVAGVYDQEDVDERTEAWGAGTLCAFDCARACSVLLHLDPARGGELSLTGGARPVAALEATRTWFASFSDGRPRSFAYHAQPGWLAVDGASPRAAGDLVLFLDNVTAVRDEGGRTVLVDATQRREPMEGPAGALGERVRQTFVVARLAGASVEGDGAATLLAPTLSARTDGLEADHARGWLDVDGRRVRLDGARVALRGALDAPLAGAAAALPLDAPTLQAAPRGDARLVLVDGERLDPGPAAARETLAWASLVGVAAAALLAAKAGGLAGFSRFTRASALRNPVRVALLDALRERPGLTTRQLADAVGLSWGLAEYHLRMLVQHQFVRVVGRARKRSYYAAESPVDEPSVGAALLRASEVRLRVARAVAEAPAPLTQREIAAAVGASPRLVSYHLGRLAKAGLVVRAEGPMRRYAPGPPLGAAFDLVGQQD